MSIDNKELQVPLTDQIEEDQGLEVPSIDLSRLYQPSSTYTPEQKVQAVMAYLVTGTSRKASRLCNVPEATIRDWKTRSDWWHDTMVQCRRAKADELDATFSNIMESTTSAIIDRIQNGDYERDKTSGELVRTPMGGKELATIAGIIFDKRQLLRGDATSRSVSVSKDELLTELQGVFQKMAEKLQGRTIDGEVVRIHNQEESQ